MNHESKSESQPSPVKRFYQNLKKDLDRTSAYTGWYYRANDSSVEINDGKSFLRISSSPANSDGRLIIWHVVEIVHKSDLIHIRDQIVCAADCKGDPQDEGGGGGGGGSYEFTVPVSAALILHAMENNRQAAIRQAVVSKGDFRRFDIRVSVPVEELISFFYKLFASKSPWNLTADKKVRPSPSLRSLDEITSYLESLGVAFVILDNDEDPHGAIFKSILS
jgi:hypothetical protein